MPQAVKGRRPWNIPLRAGSWTPYHNDGQPRGTTARPGRGWGPFAGPLKASLRAIPNAKLWPVWLLHQPQAFLIEKLSVIAARYSSAASKGGRLAPKATTVLPYHPFRQVRNACGDLCRGRGEKRYGEDHVGVQFCQLTDVPIYVLVRLVRSRVLALHLDRPQKLHPASCRSRNDEVEPSVSPGEIYVPAGICESAGDVQLCEEV